ncbi:two component transcriptional regulator [Shimwellia blattae DSM 4481 = NBRC 105725]|uniref:Two component transcriptional regulator n=1 Tax=Shimwellia blattae (strain ATCC 29907 / DSM 4481 / JCM 1650 / NBRC 105725 / CDC 9005-74) TaxID=630626 RepID=I2B915_SHIBC|nr:LuxR C-terminal-related transcriptional regulator [Shimwellia blattae]AFJ47019.1 two component transcriptional regulator [Shimwellia blattae DSM 4481 = NBRC 105725]GAB80858.1 putative transcriptional regulator [Shimwellia blattae DSM 4481 = NBRC 105725]VEC22621.1 Transcriptional regulatory protein fixJ [Shimwellia blattae]
MQQYIYLIEQDGPVREVAGQALHAAGWQCRSYTSASQFRLANPQLTPLCGCVLADVRHAGEYALIHLEEWRAQGLIIPVILMSRHATVGLCRQAFRQGAFDFLPKPLEMNILLDTVGDALEHQRRGHLHQRRRQDLRGKLALLTPREKDVLAQIMCGKASKEIARFLTLSPRTVEAHRASIFSKLEVNTVTKLLTRYSDVYPPGPRSRAGSW